MCEDLRQRHQNGPPHPPKLLFLFQAPFSNNTSPLRRRSMSSVTVATLAVVSASSSSHSASSRAQAASALPALRTSSANNRSSRVVEAAALRRACPPQRDGMDICVFPCYETRIEGLVSFVSDIWSRSSRVLEKATVTARARLRFRDRPKF